MNEEEKKDKSRSISNNTRSKTSEQYNEFIEQIDTKYNNLLKILKEKFNIRKKELNSRDFTTEDDILDLHDIYSSDKKKLKIKKNIEMDQMILKEQSKLKPLKQKKNNDNNKYI